MNKFRISSIILGLGFFGAFSIYIAARQFHEQDCSYYIPAYEKLPAFQPPSKVQTEKYERCKRGEE